MTTSSDPRQLLKRLLRLWGKTTADPDRFHPALYHMFDVAHVAQQLLSPRASTRWRWVLANALNAEANTLPEWLPYLIALHDLGKISVPFQVLNEKQLTRLKTEGVSFGKATRKDGRDLHHTLVGRLVLQDTDTVVGWPKNLQVAFIEMVSGHHGIFQWDEWEHRRNFKRLKEGEEWSRLRQLAIQILQSYLLQQWPDPLPNPTNQSVAIMALNGFCILCDWLGSDEDDFAPTPLTPLTEYVLQSRQRAHRRVRDAGFFQTTASNAPTQFANLFPDIPQPRPLQTAIDAIPDAVLGQPTLTIIEAPTGEGKTEAALALTRRIGALRDSDEMYIALPTTATSNAMFERVQIHLRQRLSLPAEMVKLVHGHNFLVEVKPMESIELNGQTESPSLAWFAPKTKALLAPIGVGTIDQAELSALNVRHNALRMIGLAGKTVILDEVHAYDTYMTTIIKRMLTWLSALGSSVILLSATLPKARRQELLQAFTGQDIEAKLNPDAYPSLMIVSSTHYHLDTPVVYQPDKPVAVHQPNKTITLHLRTFADEDALAKAAWLLDRVTQGGCACWITNTVKRAQQSYAALLKIAPADVTSDLLHARFPLVDRESREKEILSRYGKNGNRPDKAIVVGTQVLEQSLDLDFDVMMTDLAPIDLILQRAGRLHRHEREKAMRYDHQQPQLYVNTVIEEADNAVYDEYILRKSLLTLQNIETGYLSLPADYRTLIESVYDGKEPETDDSLHSLWKDLEDKKDGLVTEAKQRLMNNPKPDAPFYRDGKPKDLKDEEEGSDWLSASTRWGQESITVIPLLWEDEAARLVSGGEAIALDQKANRETQLALLRQSVRISQPKLVEHLKALPEHPKLFTDASLLKNCFPLWMEKRRDEFIALNTPLPMQLHPELGLVIGELQMKRPQRFKKSKV